MTFHHRMPPHVAAEHARELDRLRALRRMLEERVERDLALLDALEGDPDFEPSLCGREVGGYDVRAGAWDDRERETEHDEPSLGWPENSCQVVSPGYGPGRGRWPAAAYAGFDPATLASGTDGRRCEFNAADLEAGDDTGIGDRDALDMLEQPGQWAA